MGKHGCVKLRDLMRVSGLTVKSILNNESCLKDMLGDMVRERDNDLDYIFGSRVRHR